MNAADLSFLKSILDKVDNLNKKHKSFRFMVREIWSSVKNRYDYHVDVIFDDSFYKITNVRREKSRIKAFTIANNLNLFIRSNGYAPDISL